MPPPPARAPLSSEMSATRARSEEHTSELQSRLHLVCRLLLEKKKKKSQKIVVALKQKKYRINSFITIKTAFANRSLALFLYHARHTELSRTGHTALYSIVHRT